MNARDEIASRLWWSVPSADDAEAKAITEQMLDAYRADVLAEALAVVDNDDTCGCGGCDTCIPRQLAARIRQLPGGPTKAVSGPASQPPLKGLVRQIRATANAEFATGHGRAVRDFARELETWIPEDFEPGGGQR